MFGKLGIQFVFFVWTLFLVLRPISTAIAQSKISIDSLIQLMDESDDDSIRLKVTFEIIDIARSPEERLLYSKEALKLSKSLNSIIDIANGNLSLGQSYNALGQYTFAISYLIESVKLFEMANEPGGVAITYSEIAESYAELKDYRNSISYHKKGIKIFEQIEYTGSHLAVAQVNLGEVFRELNQIDSALIYYQKSEGIFKGIDHKVAIAICSGNIGLLYGEQNQYEVAEEKINDAISILKEFNQWDAIAEYKTLLADIYLEQGKLKDAMDIASSAYVIAVNEGMPERIKDASLKLSELYKTTKEFEQAYNYQSQYLIYRDSINNEEVIRKIADLRTEYEVGQKQAEVELEQAKVKILEDEAYHAELKFWGLSAVVVFVLVIFAIGLKLYRSRMIALRLADARFDIINDQRKELDGMNTLKDQFFSVISHDLRGPMGNLVGVTDLIQMHLDDESYQEISDVNQMLRHSSQEVSELLENLLNWSMSEQGAMVYVPIEVSAEEICNPALRVLQLTANQKDITLTQELRSEVMFNADVSTVSTAIRNLLSNALKFTEENGQVDLTVRQEGDFGVISIKDNGIGVPESKMETLFSFTGGRKRWGTKGEKGVGLGLNLVKSFIELNHGRIEVTSTEDVGSIFSVYLPLYKEG